MCRRMERPCQHKEVLMQKKYIVRLLGEERTVCHVVVKKLQGSSQKVKRAQILLKTDANGGLVGRTLKSRRLSTAVRKRWRNVTSVRSKREFSNRSMASSNCRRHGQSSAVWASRIDRPASGNAAVEIRPLACRSPGDLHGRATCFSSLDSWERSPN